MLPLLYNHHICSSVARQTHACYVDWIIGRASVRRRRLELVRCNTVGGKPDLLNCLCMITSSAKQSSAFSDIVAILSIMAKVSLSRQMSRKYILYISLGHLLFFPVAISYYLTTEKRSSVFLHLAKYRKQSFSINFVGNKSSSFFCLVE